MTRKNKTPVLSPGPWTLETTAACGMYCTTLRDAQDKEICHLAQADTLRNRLQQAVNFRLLQNIPRLVELFQDSIKPMIEAGGELRLKGEYIAVVLNYILDDTDD